MTIRLGVYALGAADQAERLLIEAHLPECDDCRAQLASLAPLPELLSLVPQERVAGHSPQVDGVPLPASRVPATGGKQPFDRAGRRARTRTRTRSLAGSWRTVTATATALAAGLAGGFWLLSSAVDTSPTPQTFSAVDTATHVQASAALSGTSWGTSIQVTADGLPRGQLCWLVVHSRTGGTEVDGYWKASEAGPIKVPASAAWQPSDIASVQVVADSGVLVTIPASPGPAQ